MSGNFNYIFKYSIVLSKDELNKETITSEPYFPRYQVFTFHLLTVFLAQNQTRKCTIKVNETKSVHVNFANTKVQYMPVRINIIGIPNVNGVKGLDITLGAKL